MASQKLPIKEILAAIDFNARSVWQEFSDEEKKAVSFWLLNRYASSVQGSREDQELAIFKTNEYYNKNFSVIGVGKDNGHPELMWQLLCLSGNWNAVKFHPCLGFKKKAGNNTKAVNLLLTIYPNMKEQEAELLAGISTKRELTDLAEEHGLEKPKL